MSRPGKAMVLLDAIITRNHEFYMQKTEMFFANAH
jgi:hypothetical protein